VNDFSVEKVGIRVYMGVLGWKRPNDLDDDILAGY